MNSIQTVWFEVGLDTLRLKQVDMDSWPEGMTRTASRMKEECLENVVALNLDLLFPGEDLVLVGNQFPDALNLHVAFLPVWVPGRPWVGRRFPWANP